MSTVTLTSIYPQGFERTQSLGSTKSTAEKSLLETRILGRTVKFWDFRFRIFGDFYALTQANINIRVAFKCALVTFDNMLIPFVQNGGICGSH